MPRLWSFISIFTYGAVCFPEAMTEQEFLV
jgi:hypothetical protein